MRTAFSFCAGPAAMAGIAPPMSLEIPVQAKPSKLPAAAAWLGVARYAMAAGDHAQALKAFENAIAEDERLAIAHLGRAVCLSQMDREDEAHTAIEATLAAAQGQEEVLYALARMCAREGQTSFAIPLLVEAVRGMPSLHERVEKDVLFADHPTYLAAVGRL
ncbi:MAG TPA: tetratricopeptide repeat protein [Candidatus Thermoplasmatota archaeon]|nr:tetratricopeptide repeat protein [Candidatus Thermoplasmatota archaeon]